MLTALAAITAGVGGPVALWKLVRAWVTGEVSEVVDDLRKELQPKVELLARDVVHNRANADQKFVAHEIKLDRNTADIVVLGKADVEHTVAIKHLDETLRTGFAGLDRRFDELAARLIRNP